MSNPKSKGLKMKSASLRIFLTCSAFACLIFIFSSLFSGSSIGATMSSGNETETGILTIYVQCDPQGITDQDHTIELEVVDADPEGDVDGDTTDDTFTITIHIPAHSDLEGIVGIIESALESKIDGNSNDEVTHKPSRRPGAIDIELADDGSRFNKVKIDGTAIVTDHKGHMEVYSSDVKGWKGSAPIPPTYVLRWVSMDMKCIEYSGSKLGMHLLMFGVEDHAQVEYGKRLIYRTGMLPAGNIFKPIGNYLAGLGMTITYPSYYEMHVDATTSQFHMREVYFTMFNETDASSPEDFTCHFGFEVE